ncbi:hypothetical protein Tco_0123827 [Tanacetum coccineum]
MNEIENSSRDISLSDWTSMNIPGSKSCFPDPRIREKSEDPNPDQGGKGKGIIAKQSFKKKNNPLPES